MQIKNQRDIYSGLMFLAVGVVFGLGATRYSMGSPTRPGAGYFPLILSVLMVILGVIVLFKALRSDHEGDNSVGKVAWRPLLVVVGSIVVFGLALPLLGMFITVPLLIVLVSMAGDEFSWKTALATSAVLTLGSWAVFVWGLNLTLPLKPTFLG